MNSPKKPKRYHLCIVFFVCIAVMIVYSLTVHNASSNVHRFIAHINLGASPSYVDASPLSIDAKAKLLFEQIREKKTIEQIISTLAASASSGKLFLGKPVRKFNINDVKFKNKRYQNFTDRTHDGSLNCTSWAVLTTIFSPPSEAVRRFLYLTKWCVVIVGDRAKPTEYLLKSSQRERNMVFLSDRDQINMKSIFVDRLPWYSFGRKNVGYLYAIAHGAKVIWDFDDDNMLKFWVEGASPSANLWIENFSELKLGYANSPVSLITSGIASESTGGAQFFNPYPLLGCPSDICWPRGYPLTIIRDSANKDKFHLVRIANNVNLTRSKVGVLQSLADHEPDVDALYRLIIGTPFKFKRPKKGSDSQPLLLLSNGIYSPFNAQATLYFREAFLTLYLPVTVSGRVSDIWRSYIAQTLLSLHRIVVGFMPRPLVDQDRNSHSLLADLESELALYTQTNALVSFLDEWRRNKTITGDSATRSMEDLLEEVYIETYERGFIELEDVYNIQNWINALGFVGFQTQSQAEETRESSFLSNQLIHVNDEININVGSSIIVSTKGEPEECNIITSKQIRSTYWTSDLHDGTRLDTPSILTSLGQTFVVAGYKRDKTPYPNVFKRPGFIIPRNISKEIMHYRINTEVTKDIIQNNFEFYKHDKLFQNTKAFYCSFYASMCQLWMPLNRTKSILVVAGHRYNLGRCTVDSWTKLNKQLVELAGQKNLQVHQKHIIAGASRYDYEYLKHYIGLKDDIHLISSFSGFYTAGFDYNPTEPEILIEDRFAKYFINKTTFPAIRIHQKYSHWELSDLVKHRAIVYVPYSVMSFKLTDFYSLNIPLFMPSAKYFRNRGGFGPDRTSTTKPYCTKDPDLWWKMPSHDSSPHAYNPNAEFKEDQEAEMYWLQFSDFFDWPYIQYFDDIPDLNRKVANADFYAIHNAMKAENAIRKYELMNKWCKIIAQINNS